jgi:hypothetical protein
VVRLIYIAGPIGKDPQRPLNVKAGMEAAHAVIAAGHTPICPHLFFFLDTMTPGAVGYEGWMRVDFHLLSKCDGLWRLPGASPGADREVAFAEEKGIPVSGSLLDLLERIFQKESSAPRCIGTVLHPPNEVCPRCD